MLRNSHLDFNLTTERFRCYDPARDSWSPKRDFPTALRTYTFATNPEEKIYDDLGGLEHKIVVIAPDHPKHLCYIKETANYLSRCSKLGYQ